MKTSVIFVFRSERVADTRRIRCTIPEYAIKPAAGEKIVVPVAPTGRPNELICGTVVEIWHDPMQCYFQNTGCCVECLVSVNASDFDTAFRHFFVLREAKQLTHQWANWTVSGLPE